MLYHCRRILYRVCLEVSAYKLSLTLFASLFKSKDGAPVARIYIE